MQPSSPATSVLDESSDFSSESDHDDESELEADPEHELQGEAEASVNALLADTVASTDIALFADMVILTEAAGMYDASLEWLDEHLRAHRARLSAFQDQEQRTLDDMHDLVQRSEELDSISARVRRMRQELTWAEKQFRRKYQCGH